LEISSISNARKGLKSLKKSGPTGVSRYAAKNIFYTINKDFKPAIYLS
jgi:hypothetical protein